MEDLHILWEAQDEHERGPKDLKFGMRMDRWQWRRTRATFSTPERRYATDRERESVGLEPLPEPVWASPEESVSWMPQWLRNMAAKGRAARERGELD